MPVHENRAVVGTRSGGGAVAGVVSMGVDAVEGSTLGGIGRGIGGASVGSTGEGEGDGVVSRITVAGIGPIPDSGGWPDVGARGAKR